MKRILLGAVIAVSCLLPVAVRAETLMGFQDGSLYDQNGNYRYMCFLDGGCIDKDGNVTTRAKLGLSALPKVETVAATPQPTPQVTYVPVYVPQPVSQPVDQLVSQPAGASVPTSTVVTDNSLLPYNPAMTNFDTIKVTAPSTSGVWDKSFTFSWNPSDAGKRLNGELIFNGQTVLNGNGNAVTFSIDGSSFAVGDRTWVNVSGPFEPNTQYSFIYNQDGRTVTRHFSYNPGVAIVGE